MKYSYRKSLLLGSSMLAFNAALSGAVFLAPNQAHAACTAVNSNITISDSSNTCLTWNSNNITITGSGVVTGSSTAIDNSAGSIVGSLINSGTISGNNFGLSTTGTITAITNNGLIYGGVDGIYNISGGSIGTITNHGTIETGGLFAINTNIGDSIATIFNDGKIISTGWAGIYNNGIVDNITNAAGGTIHGVTTAGIRIDGVGSVGIITNSGTISGDNFGIKNAGLIGGGVTAIASTGTIIGAISNNGTISGNINANQSLTLTGAGTLMDGTITANNVVFDSSANQALTDQITVGAGTVTNNGILRIAGVQSITGNYAQGSSGVIRFTVTDSITYGALDISGAANMLNDHVSIGGFLTSGDSYTILRASNIGTNYSGLAAFANGYAISLSSITGGGIESLIATVNTCTNQTIGSNTTVNSSVCGITWNGGNISITSGVAVAGQTTAIINSGNIVGSLTNNGFISGNIYGIVNSGSITTITNNNNILGGTDAIRNTTGNVIGTINNSGVISGNAGFGINNDGTIGAITNSGSGIIAGGTAAAIKNSGTITGIITNNGTISGAIVNDTNRIIGTIINTGVIGHNGSGTFDNSGTITLINNSGTIGGNGYNGLHNNGTVGTFINSGWSDGLWNTAGSIGTVSNSGTITGGGMGVYVTGGSINTIINNIGGYIHGNSYAIDIDGGSATGVSNAGILEGGNGINLTSSISTIANSGTILASSAGVNLNNAIGTITNSGTIVSNNIGIAIRSIAGAVINTGSIINEGTSNILNQGTIGIFSNSGLVYGNNSSAFHNDSGTIGTLTNLSTGTLTGRNNVAIVNIGSISVINNSGLISNVGNPNAGINNGSGTIATITNNGTGTIIGSSGISNSDEINLINNSGTIVGSSFGINNTGFIGGGVTAITSTGTIIGAISNTGTISGNINTNQALTFSGSAGTLTGGTIVGSSVTFNNGAHQILNDRIAVGSGTVTNNGSLQLDAIQSITGNYSQSSLATLYIDVTDSITYGRFSISGIASMANSRISISGSLTLGDTYTIAQASSAGTDYSNVVGSVTGYMLSWSSITGGGIESLIATLNACTNQTISSNTTVNSNVCGITWNSGDVVINSGISVSGSNTAIVHSGVGIGNLTNNGVINGTSSGISNSGTINTLTNNNSISTDFSHAIGNSGSISTIINNNYINAGSADLYNSGHVGAFVNNAGHTIVSGSAAIWNNGGTIDSLSNSGVINSGTAAIWTDGTSTIGTVTNSGVINANSDGIHVDNSTSTINAITNSGTITAGIIDIINHGTIGTISNSGLISSSSYVILSDGTILNAISNSGTIAGYIDVSQALTFTGGNSSAYGTLSGYNGSISTIVTQNHDLTFDSNAYQLLDNDINVGASNSVINSGHLRVNAPRNISGNYVQTASGVLVIGVTDASNYGKLVVGGSATMTNGQVLVLPTSGALSAGSFTIVSASSTGTDYTGVNASANGFTSSSSSITGGGLNQLVITLASTTSGGGGGSGGGTDNTYSAAGKTAGGGVAPAIGSALDQIQSIIANGGNSSFAPILVSLNNLGQSTPAQQAAIQELGPSQIGPQLASTNILMNQGSNVIAQHQQNLLSYNDAAPAGRAAGSEYRSGMFWGQVSGGVANQSSTPTLGGYSQSSYGITLGADDRICKDTTLGIAFGWMHGNSDGKDSLAGTNVSANSYQFMTYASHRSGPAFVSGMLGLGYNRFNQNRNISFLGTTATSSYAGLQYIARVDTGWDFAINKLAPIPFTLTPMIGFQAVHTDNDGYTESGAGAANLTVGRQIINSYATTLGVKASTNVKTSWGDLTPEIKLGWAHNLNNNPIPTNGTLAGVNFTTTTPRVAQDGFQPSVALTLQQSDRLSFRAEYNGDIRSDFQSHTGLVKANWSF